MIIKLLEDIENSQYRVEGDTWISRRLLIKDDNMGFTINDTIIKAGTESEICYKDHLEACYCVEGEGEIESIDPEQKISPLYPGVLYALDKHDRHILRANKTMRLICTFTPPLKGTEKHNADGSYSLD